MLESNCCGASPLWESDICSQCGEHAEFEEVDNEPTEFFNQKVKECLENFYKEFTYIETDDESATESGLTYGDVLEIIEGHNEVFKTDYKSIEEFNESEPHRKILVTNKQTRS